VSEELLHKEISAGTMPANSASVSILHRVVYDDPLKGQRNEHVGAGSGRAQWLVSCVCESRVDRTSTRMVLPPPPPPPAEVLAYLIGAYFKLQLSDQLSCLYHSCS